MCCGSRRAAWRHSATPTRSSVAPPATPAPRAAGAASPWTAGAFPTAPIRYGGPGEVSVRGPVTGRAYRFSGAEPTQAVDVRDAAVLLRGAAFQPG